MDTNVIDFSSLVNASNQGKSNTQNAVPVYDVLKLRNSLLDIRGNIGGDDFLAWVELMSKDSTMTESAKCELFGLWKGMNLAIDLVDTLLLRKG